MGYFLIISILAVRAKYPFKFEDIEELTGEIRVSARSLNLKGFRTFRFDLE